VADEEKKPSGGLSIGSVSGENVKIVGGDNTEDNSKGKTHNEVHGDVGNLTSHQTNNFGGSLDEDLKNFFEEMKTKAPELTDEQENTSGGLPPRDIPSKEDPVVVPIEELEGLPAAKYVDNEDHPQMVYAAVQRQADPATPAPSRRSSSPWTVGRRRHRSNIQHRPAVEHH